MVNILFPFHLYFSGVWSGPMKGLRLSPGKKISLLVSEVQTLAMLYFMPWHRPQGSLVWAESQARPYRLLRFNLSSEAVSDCKKSQSVPFLPFPIPYSADDQHQEKLGFSGSSKKDPSALQTHIQVLQRDLKSLGSFWHFLLGFSILLHLVVLLTYTNNRWHWWNKKQVEVAIFSVSQEAGPTTCANNLKQFGKR